MNTIKNLIGIGKGRTMLIIGAGATLKQNEKDITKFIEKTNPLTIGINNMTGFYVPDFHVWTNTQRFRTYGHTIDSKSSVLLGTNISLKLIKQVIGVRDYTLINYTDKEGIPMGYKNGKLYGHYRTAGCLSIMIAHIMGVDVINVVGFDGYTLYPQTDVASGNASQHCYGTGHTDTADWATCIKKDVIIDNVLQNLKDYGINFSIITPTKYEKFFDSSILNGRN